MSKSGHVSDYLQVVHNVALSRAGFAFYVLEQAYLIHLAHKKAPRPRELRFEMRLLYRQCLLEMRQPNYNTDARRFNIANFVQEN